MFFMVRRDPCQQGDMHAYPWDTNIHTHTCKHIHTHGVEPLMRSCERDQTEHVSTCRRPGPLASHVTTRCVSSQSQVVSESVITLGFFPVFGIRKNKMVHLPDNPDTLWSKLKLDQSSAHWSRCNFTACSISLQSVSRQQTGKQPHLKDAKLA